MGAAGGIFAAQVDTTWPWYFSLVAVVLWMLAMLAIAALLLRRLARRRKAREAALHRRLPGSELALVDPDRSLPPGG